MDHRLRQPPRPLPTQLDRHDIRIGLTSCRLRFPDGRVRCAMGNRETGNLMDERRPIESMWSERMKAAEEQCHLARAEADAALELCCCGDTSAQIEALRQTFARE